MNENRNKGAASALAEALVLMAALQALRELLLRMAQPMLPDTLFARKMITMVILAAFAVLLLLYGRRRGQSFSVFPAKFTRPYIIFTCVAAALLLSSPANYIQGLPAVLALLYGSVVTPVFEELLFRGYIWGRLERAGLKGLTVYLWSAALFTLWHLGYMLPQLTQGNWYAVVWKLAAGAGYGVVLGFVRLRAKNCYAAMLLHGVMNLFMV